MTAKEYKTTEKLKVGDEVTVTLKVKVKHVSDAHGLCYQVELPLLDYQGGAREFFLEPEEIQNT
jgi:hypothetical protein